MSSLHLQFPPSERLVVAMSGGVDSSLAAWLLAERGHPLVGLFMRNGIEVDEAEAAKKACCSLSDARDARMVAERLGIAFQAVDLADEFQGLIERFVAEYGRGRTPNPCLACNRDLKLGRLIELADELGAAGVATGHYARLAVEDGRVRIRRGADGDKDQSYQLFCVPEAQLARTVLPLGGYTKPQVRELARQAGLRTHDKRDSQEICFVPGDDYRALLAERGLRLHPGPIVDTSGRVLGEHAGTEHFTIGQRRGIGVAAAEPYYVVELVPEEGRVVVGFAAECLVHSMTVADLNWIGFDPPEGDEWRCLVQHRHRCTPVPAVVELGRDGEGAAVAQVRFERGEASVTPGQGAAFYEGDLLLGGGWIGDVVREGAGER